MSFKDDMKKQIKDRRENETKINAQKKRELDKLRKTPIPDKVLTEIVQNAGRQMLSRLKDQIEYGQYEKRLYKLAFERGYWYHYDFTFYNIAEFDHLLDYKSISNKDDFIYPYNEFIIAYKTYNGKLYLSIATREHLDQFESALKAYLKKNDCMLKIESSSSSGPMTYSVYILCNKKGEI